MNLHAVAWFTFSEGGLGGGAWGDGELARRVINSWRPRLLETLISFWLLRDTEPIINPSAECLGQTVEGL